MIRDIGLILRILQGSLTGDTSISIIISCYFPVVDTCTLFLFFVLTNWIYYYLDDFSSHPDDEIGLLAQAN